MVEDINPKWYSVIRRLQSISKSNGFSILSIRILVDSHGNPIAWTEPRQTKIEPKGIEIALLQLGLTNLEQT